MKLKIFLFTYFIAIACLIQAQPYTSLQNSPESTAFGTRATDYTNFPGYVDPIDYLGKTCFDVMGKVDFTSEYRFKSEGKNGTTDVLYGFSIPLVADLNGDGYPEIIGISSSGTVGGIEGKYDGIQILNGQTGELISKIKFPWLTSGYYYHLGHHGSPSIMALVDSDRDDTVEVIFAIPYHGGAPTSYHNTLVSCNIVYDATSKRYSLSERWKAHNFHSPASYLFEKPIPQVVDINGDGVSEVLVYNKIYNAVDGRLLFTLETMGTNAFIGSGVNAGHASDGNIGFNYVYDMDLDGVYDIVAGGKIYRMLVDGDGKLTGYETIVMSGVGDGRTGVADINGDGIPDVVTVTRNSTSNIELTVWNPDFWKINETTGKREKQNNPQPKILGKVTLPLSTASLHTTGSNSYVYIGDIDGRVQEVDGKKYRLPEIAILGGRYTYNSNIHPNVIGKGIPTSGVSNSVGTGRDGVIVAVTWDATQGLTATNRLKTSFILGHEDSSTNTGFTMFDFDNDGIQEICYRDEQNLRIIKPTRPYITASETILTSPDVIKFSQVVKSYTGFEYPVIADIDNDASAEMVVMGHSKGDLDATGYVYAVGNGSGDKFAPALSVWNQFMYDPFKINEDLTTPLGPAPDRLDDKFFLSKVVRDENMNVSDVLENYNPFNGTLIQMSKFQLDELEWNGTTYENAFEPIIFLTHSYFVEPSLTSPAKNPKIIKEGGKIYIVAWVGNESEAQTDLSQNTPVAVYKNEISKTSIYKMTTLAQAGLNSAVKAGQEREIKIEVNDEFGYYILRLGDNSFNLTSPYAFKGAWSYGTNVLGVQDDENHMGTAARAYRDCNWSDQVLKVSKFMVSDDAYTLQTYRRINTPILDNDIMPDDFIGGFDGPSPRVVITQQPKSGIVIASGEINKPANTNTVKIEYQHTGTMDLVDGIDMFEYEVSYYDAATSTTKQVKAKAYFYILQDVNERNTACVGDNITLNLRTRPSGTTFKWYEADGLTELANNPQSGITINNITSTLKYMILPQVPSSNTTYGNINFPKGEFTIVVVPSTNADLKWTGIVNKVWSNPYNWTDLSGNAVDYSPVACVDVTIPMVTTNYPEMSALGQSGKLTLMDRAMIGNVHKLTYESVSMEMTIKTAEQNRWLMLSAPLSSLYAGDYKVKDTSGNQVEKAAYISLYNTQDPDNGQAAANNTFSRPFGKIEQSLQLGTAFMLYIDELFAVNAAYRFPATNDQYLYTPSNAVGAASRDYNSNQLTRTNSGRFIFEEANNYNATNGSFSITLNDDKYHLVVNPFPSYLNLNVFLNENTMLEPEYKVWTGKSNDTFISLVSGNNKAPRWEINATAAMESVDLTGTSVVYIAPYQAFFVKKKSTGAGSTVISFKPETMTITKAGDYTL